MRYCKYVSLLCIIISLTRAQPPPFSSPHVRPPSPTSPYIAISPTDETVREGQTVNLNCQIANFDEAVMRVEWVFVNHELTLYRNGHLLTNDPRFRRLGPIMDSPYSAHDIQIKNVTTYDAGVYTCRLHGVMAASANIKVDVPGTSAPNYTLSGTFDRTSCCRREGIMEPCLWPCRASSLLSNISRAFSPSMFQCARYYSKYFTCATDHRSHISCCLDKKVSQTCLPLCTALSTSSDLRNPALLNCLTSLPNILACTEEGQQTIPLPPTNVSVSAVSSSRIIVNWRSPNSTGRHYNSSTIRYRVYFAEGGSSVFRWGGLRFNASDLQASTEYSLPNLKPDTRYVVYVRSITPRGGSTNSPFVSAVTKPVSIENLKPEQRISVCCTDQGIGEDCRKQLCSTNTSTVAKTLECVKELPKAIKCLSGRYNHEPCCKRNNVPDRCLLFCSGNHDNDVFNATRHSSCVRWMSEMNECFMFGNLFLPNPVSEFFLVNVTNSTATFKWKPPANVTGSRAITGYELSVIGGDGEIGGNVAAALQHVELTFLSNDVLSYTISKLNPSHDYEAFIRTKNSNGTSSISSIINFRTYSSDAAKPIVSEFVAESESRIAECCKESYVTIDCQTYCELSIVEMVSQSNTTSPMQFLNAYFNECHEDMNKINFCHMDGKNHGACCEKRGVPSDCLIFCNATSRQALDRATRPAYSSPGSMQQCTLAAPSIAMCFEEGKGTLPNPPRALMIKSFSYNHIGLEWNPPRTGPAVTTYTITYTAWLAAKEYHTDAASLFLLTPTKFEITNVNTTHYILQNLRAGSRYTIRVLSANDAGISLPSSVVTFRTPSSKPIRILNPTAFYQNVSHCCEDAGIANPTCLSHCKNINNTSYLNTTVNECSDDLWTYLHCWTGQRDHSECCKGFGLTHSCRRICSGKALNLNSMIERKCVSHAKEYLTCFREGIEVLPAPPGELQLQNITRNSVTILWKGKSDEEFDVLYYDGQLRSTYRASDVKPPYTLKDLHPATEYSISLISRNVHGSSLPTPELTFWTWDNPSSELITITTVPTSPWFTFRNGLKLELYCAVSRAYSPNVNYTYQWLDSDGKPIKEAPSIITGSQTSKLTLWKAKAHDSGVYTCKVDWGGKAYRNSRNIRIMAYPKLVSKSPDTVLNFQSGSTVRLWCKFDGNPTDFSWMLAYKPITSYRIRYIDDTTVQSFIEIEQLKAFVGTYKCTAVNSLGKVSAQIAITSPEQVFAEESPRECCKEKHMPDRCLPMCDSNINLQHVTPRCTPHFVTALSCYAGGRSAESCCISKNVPSLCRQFCSPADLNANSLSTIFLFTCLRHMSNMLGCLAQTLAPKPGPPQNVALVQPVLADNLTITWSAPTLNAPFVRAYRLLIENDEKTNDPRAPFNVTLGNSWRKFSFTSLLGNFSYAARLYSIAFDGSEIPMSGPAIPCTPEPLSPDQVAKSALTLSLLNRTSLKWSLERRGDYHATLYEQLSNGIWLNKMVETSPVSLNSATKQLFITVAGKVSPVIQVTDAVNIVEEAQTSSSSMGGGSVAGLVIGIILLLLFAIFVAFAFVKRKAIRHYFTYHQFNDSTSVQFDNLGASMSDISGGTSSGGGGVDNEPKLTIDGLSSTTTDT